MRAGLLSYRLTAHCTSRRETAATASAAAAGYSLTEEWGTGQEVRLLGLMRRPFCAPLAWPACAMCKCLTSISGVARRWRPGCCPDVVAPVWPACTWLAVHTTTVHTMKRCKRDRQHMRMLAHKTATDKSMQRVQTCATTERDCSCKASLICSERKSVSQSGQVRALSVMRAACNAESNVSTSTPEAAQ